MVVDFARSALMAKDSTNLSIGLAIVNGIGFFNVSVRSADVVWSRRQHLISATAHPELGNLAILEATRRASSFVYS
jgi:hypothetical protein